MAYCNSIRVLILHYDPIARAGLAATFGKYPDLEVVNVDYEPDAGAPGLCFPVCCSADVVVADYENGIELAMRGLRRPGSGEPLKIMIVASTDREWEIRKALERGVRGYMLVGCSLEELACCVRAVHRGLRHLCAPVAHRLAESMSGEPLTAREEEVLRLVVEGLGNKSIARSLNIAVGTVKSHLKGVFDKLGVDSRTQAICAVERRGLLRNASQRAQRASNRQAAGAAQPRFQETAREHTLANLALADV